jgi:hypothetical protein
MATDWTVRSGDRNPVGTRFSAPVHTGPGAHPATLYNGYRVFPGGKEWPRRDADTSPPSRPEESYRLWCGVVCDLET